MDEAHRNSTTTRWIVLKQCTAGVVHLRKRCVRTKPQSQENSQPEEKEVRVEGLEPPRLAALDPKSSASTNSAIPATYVKS